jgi:TPR repeat protein
LLDELENVTQSIAEKIKDRDFKKRVDEADREEKRFEQFGIDEEKAFLGDARAQFAIGKAHAVGGGSILKDLFCSYFWLTLAAAHGVKEAKHYRDRIAKQVTPQQIGEAEALAASWKPMTPDEWERHNAEIIAGLRARFESQ